jgi:hypothetical protein
MEGVGEGEGGGGGGGGRGRGGEVSHGGEPRGNDSDEVLGAAIHGLEGWGGEGRGGHCQKEGEEEEGEVQSTRHDFGTAKSWLVCSGRTRPSHRSCLWGVSGSGVEWSVHVAL